MVEPLALLHLVHEVHLVLVEVHLVLVEAHLVLLQEVVLVLPVQNLQAPVAQEVILHQEVLPARLLLNGLVLLVLKLEPLL